MGHGGPPSVSNLAELGHSGPLKRLNGKDWATLAQNAFDRTKQLRSCSKQAAKKWPPTFTFRKPSGLA